MKQTFREKWYIGRTGSAARALAERDGWYVRVMSEEPRAAATPRQDRVSLELDGHGIVVSARVC
jgi:hypothetical protein